MGLISNLSPEMDKLMQMIEANLVAQIASQRSRKKL
jgi:hypothetical protein